MKLKFLSALVLIALFVNNNRAFAYSCECDFYAWLQKYSLFQFEFENVNKGFFFGLFGGNSNNAIAAVSGTSLGAAAYTCLGKQKQTPLNLPPAYNKPNSFPFPKPTKTGNIALVNTIYENQLPAREKELSKYIQNALNGGYNNPNVIAYSIQIENSLLPPKNDVILQSGENFKGFDRVFYLNPELIKSSFNPKQDQPGTYTAEITFTYFGEL